jgi:hypothetical protein
MINLGLPTTAAYGLQQDINISPNSNGLPGIGQLSTIVGASMTVGLILAVLGLIISAVVWALGANSSNPHLAGRGKLGVLVGLGAAIITGASVALVNFFWTVGQSV